MYFTFLESVLEDLQKKAIDLTACTYVLPSKRSGTFLKKHIAHRLTQNRFAPEVLSIQDFLCEVSGMTQGASLDLLLQLYEVYKKVVPEAQEEFHTFLKWAPTLLQDFNEIDSFLVPAQALFRSLSAIKELHHWAVAEEKTPLIKNYLAFWKHLLPLYEGFTAALLAQKRGYAGLLYRTAVAQLSRYCNDRGPRPIVFVGFNALNTAESKIIQHCLAQGYGYVYWDIDTHFLNDPLHDAGLFIRKYQQEWPYYQKHPLSGVHSSFLSPKKIAAVGVPKRMAQTKYAGHLLQQMATQSPEALEKTALVLADESLRAPMLHAIPAAVHKVNITMGLPLKNTVLYTFFTSFLQLHLNKTERGWFYRDVLVCMSNPYVARLSSGTKNWATALSQAIKANNWLYITPQRLAPYTKQHPGLSLLFLEDKPTPLQWIELCLALMQPLQRKYREENKPQELEYLYRFTVLFHQLRAAVKDGGARIALQALKRLLELLASGETLDFIGEPLMGLQVMGMLESRNLDFETVIITSVNEGILPAGKSNNSFLPFDVRRAYGLPTYKEQDAIYTYHFYRLIQRAKTVYLLYNTEPDVLEGGEKSRLISQLLTEEAIAPYVTHSTASPRITINTRSLRTIPKSAQLLTDLKAVAAQGFSPTSLSRYIQNPLAFYERSVLKLKDVDTVEESIANNTFGTIVHDSLEQLYTPLVGMLLSAEHLSPLLPQIPQVVRQHFYRNLPGVDCDKGKFLLVYRVIVTYIQRFIDHEIQQLSQHQVKLLELEQPYEVRLDIPALDFPVKLKGTLDRVDTIDGMLRIVDYKTGSVEPRQVKLPHWEALITDYDKSKAFQLLCYAFLYHEHHHPAVMQAGIYALKHLGQGFLPFTTGRNPTEIDAPLLAAFATSLEQLVLEICNAEVPFAEKLN